MRRAYTYYPSGALKLQTAVPGASFVAAGLEHSMLTYFEIEAHTRFPEHRHDSEQITLVLEGRLVFEVAGDRVAVGPGEIIALPSELPHAVESLDEPVKAVDAWSPPRESYR